MKKIKLSGKKLRVTFCVVIAVLVSIFVCVETVNAGRTFLGSENKKSKVKSAVKAKGKALRHSLMSQRSGASAQNDMGTRRDASDSYMDPTQIPAASRIIKLGDYTFIFGYHLRYQGYTYIWGTGYIDNDSDIFDHYKVWVETGQTIRIRMESIRVDSDYDLELLNPNGGQIAISDNGYYDSTNIRKPEEIVWVATYSGYCIIRVYVFSPSPAQTWRGFYFMSVAIIDQ